MDRKKIKKLLQIFAIASFAYILIGSVVNYFKLEYYDQHTVDYSTFQEYIKNNEVHDVTIDFQSDSISFKKNEAKNAPKYYTSNPRYDDFKKDLLEQGIEVKEHKSPDFSIVISVFLNLATLGIFFWLMKSQMGNNEKIGTIVETKSDITFQDVAGLDEVKADLINITDFLANPKKYRDAGAKLPKGVMLYGPPGTGKTLIARAMAGEANANFITTSGSDFSNKFLGAGADRVRQLFTTARKYKPCIIFIDEIDAVGGARDGQMHSENRNTLNALLSEMDGFKVDDGILVIAATNRLEDLDPALIRPGRFDNTFAVPLPSTTSERKEVIDIYTRNKKFDESVDLQLLAKQMIGNSPADIEAVINEASIIAVREHNGIISQQDLDSAYLKKILKGHVKHNAERDHEQLKLTAWHESGHTLIGTLLGQEPTKVTILPSSSGAGGFTLFPPSKMGMYSKTELENQICMLYAGRAAEELLVGPNNITTGASNDIEKATNLLKDYVTKYGMCSGETGPTILNYDQINGSDKLIMEQMNKLASQLYQKTIQILTDNRSILDHLAAELLSHESLSEQEIKNIINS